MDPPQCASSTTIQVLVHTLAVELIVFSVLFFTLYVGLAASLSVGIRLYGLRALGRTLFTPAMGHGAYNIELADIVIRL